MITNCINIKDDWFISTRDIMPNEKIAIVPFNNMPNRNDINNYPKILEYIDLLNNIDDFDFIFLIIKQKLLKKKEKHPFFNNIEFLDDFKTHPLHYENLTDLKSKTHYNYFYNILKDERKKIGILVKTFQDKFEELFERILDNDTIARLVNWAYLIMKIYSVKNFLVPLINKFKVDNSGLKFDFMENGDMILINNNNEIKNGDKIKIRRDFYDNKFNYVFYNQTSNESPDFMKVTLDFEITKSSVVNSIIQPLLKKFENDSFYFTNKGASMNLIKYLRIISMNDYNMDKLYSPGFFNKFVTLNNEHSIVVFLIRILNSLRDEYNEENYKKIIETENNNIIIQIWKSEYEITKDMKLWIDNYWLNFIPI